MSIENRITILQVFLISAKRKARDVKDINVSRAARTLGITCQELRREHFDSLAFIVLSFSMCPAPGAMRHFRRKILLFP